MLVAVLGTGIMGGPMAANLLEAGMQVRVWNRTAAKTRPLVERGATPAQTPAEAARGADVVVTMLADGATVETVMSGPDGALATMDGAATWAQMSTVGLAYTDQFASQAADAAVAFADAPVVGTKQPAEQGTLVVLASGPEQTLARCQPIFDAVGSRTITVGEAGAASRLKLVANAWVLAVTNGTAECVALAQRLGLDPRQFLETISGGLLDVPYAHLKADEMINNDYPVSFPVTHAAKDARLVLEAAGQGLDGIQATLGHLEHAAQQGYDRADFAALYEGITPMKEPRF
ncbi:NAD(P)-dependent oxidoreductase [Saccharopolyspora sp. NPDC050389]|uniref:NAD(P)-dependent oxidoreductase n=1 Tax=Saccharopolyspora sp. NPDC050389 TaxID=3155516 RepID=UPI0033D0B69B